MTRHLLLLAASLLATPIHAGAFEGCDVSGTWAYTSVNGPGTFHLEETAGGASIVGSHRAGGLLLSIGNGLRSGAAVSFQSTMLSEPHLVFSVALTMSDCDTMANEALSATRTGASYCGDGNEDPGEECDDDDDFDDDDACTIDCREVVCGNGVVEGPEECDDGNTANLDGCSELCTSHVCGDGELELPGEQCEADDEIDGDGCSRSCGTNVCGNTIVESGEDCDPGDADDGDADLCSSLCQFEGCDVTGTWHYVSPELGLEGVLTLIETGGGAALSGANVLGPIGARDGLGFVGGSRTLGTVLVQTTVVDPPLGPINVTYSMSSCDVMATTELPPIATATRLRTTYCSDGSRQPGEQCDDGNLVDSDDCTADCQLPHCPDENQDPLEECDDNNAVDTDACRTDCQLNLCGDGFQHAGVEQCDHGLANSDEPDAACRTDCGARACGDGIEDAGHGEQCDDGGTEPGDGCDGSCRDELMAEGTVPPGATTPVLLTTDPGELGASPERPVQATIESTSEGPIRLLVTSAAGPPQPGFALAGKQVDIDAAPGTVESPLRLTFVIDSSSVPAVVGDLEILRNGVPVANCMDPETFSPPGGATTCVSARTPLEGGDVRVLVLTINASTWSFATRLTFAADETACRGEVRKQLAALVTTRLAAAHACVRKVHGGTIAGPCPDAATASRIAKAEAKVDPAKLGRKCPDAVVAGLEARGLCAGAATTADLAGCMRAEAAARVDAALETEYADATASLDDKAVRTCQGAVASKGRAYLLAIQKAYASCAGARDKGRVAACLDPTGAKKVATARAKLETTIPSACPAPALAALSSLGFGGSCAVASTATQLASCQVADHEAQAFALVELLP